MIKVYYKDSNITRGIVIKCINDKKLVRYELKDEKLSETITDLVKAVLFQHAGISWIIKSNDQVNSC